MHRFAALLLLVALNVWADAPLGPPKTVEVCNALRTVCATSDPTQDSVVVRNVADGGEMWRLGFYARFFSISSTGRTLVIYSDFGNLAPANASLQTELFKVFREGILLKSVSIGDLYSDVADLTATSSHLMWGRLRVLRDDNVEIVLANGSSATLDFVIGRRVGQ